MHEGFAGGADPTTATEPRGPAERSPSVRAESAGGAEPTTAMGRSRRQASGTVARLVTLAGVAAATAYVGLVDPSHGGAYPRCPSRVLFGIDCPLCGGLRGTHDLLHGHVAKALDHNLLLPGFLGVLAVALGLWLLPLVGRPARSLQLPRRAALAAVAMTVAFTLLRNVPIGPLEFLASG